MLPFGSCLYLMRHAQALPARFYQTDKNRSLSPYGVEEAQIMGNKISALAVKSEVALVSPARRTQETFANLHLVPELPEINEDALYNGDIDTYLAILRRQNASSLLLIGHNPTVSALARHLSQKQLVDLPHSFPTAGLAVLTFSTPFQDIEFKSGTLTQFLKPL